MIIQKKVPLLLLVKILIFLLQQPYHQALIYKKVYSQDDHLQEYVCEKPIVAHPLLDFDIPKR